MRGFTTIQTALFISLVLSHFVVPSKASVNVNLGDDENDNPFQDIFCTFIACTNSGEPEALGFFENLANDLSEFTFSFGDDGGNRKLRAAPSN